MNNLELVNIFYRQKKDIPEYMDIVLETNFGILQHNVTSLDFIDYQELMELNKAEGIDTLRDKYGKLFIDEVRITYDNDEVVYTFY